MVIVDSLISFLRPGESENDSTHMRAVYDRCRVLTNAGATVALIHHLGKNGVARGSSDFQPAGDQGRQKFPFIRTLKKGERISL
jgi:RecA-family ATPase